MKSTFKRNYDIALRPIHYACVSGGKDSLYMLNLILNNLDKYPLDMVVHYDLEIDYPWTKEVIDFMESRLNEHGIVLTRIKPRHTYEELFNKWGLPNRLMRWCNSQYKCDCMKQLHKWIKEQNCRPVAYIGFCADETKRFEYEIGNIIEGQDVIYPLAEENIIESDILEWAKEQPIFNNFYRFCDRQGCMCCPMSSRKDMAYLYCFYPSVFDNWFNRVREWENNENYKSHTYFNRTQDVDNVLRNLQNKWIPKVHEICKEYNIKYER